MAKLLQLVSVGNPPPSLMKDLSEPLAAQLNVSLVISRQQLPVPVYAFNKDRNQYHSNAIMRRLSPLLEPGNQFVLGLADVDLFVPDSPFVFGEADREAKVAVVSIMRMRQGAEPDALRRRAQIEVVHETGHLLGLSYCDDSRCVMFLAISVADCDRKGLALCSVCRNELAKLNR